MPPPPLRLRTLALPLALALLCLAASLAPVTVVLAQNSDVPDTSSTGAVIDFSSTAAAEPSDADSAPTGPAAHAPLFEFSLTISNGICAPDGFNRSCVLTNGMFPAPTVVLIAGGRVRVRVRNRLTDPNQEWATAIHWHGLHQKNSSHMDGQEHSRLRASGG